MSIDEDDIKLLKIAKYKCQISTLFFTRYFFKKRFKRKFVIGEHHIAISKALDDVINGKIKKLIINIAPRYGKTELAVKNFIAMGLALNPSARFIHLSYSDDLALDNSEDVKNIVNEDSYKQLFSGVKIKHGSDSKKKWYTTEGGGVYATSTKGQVTGFGAGKVDDEDLDFIQYSTTFGGALIIDDPIKPEDADSEVIRERINDRFDSTIRNRVNSRNTPIIIIMQRVHEHDLCGYLLEKEPSEWTVLSLPSIKEDGTALWPFKHTIEELNEMRRLNEVVFDRQHLQDPKPLKGLMFPKSELRYFKPTKDITDKFETSIGYADIADEGDDNLSAPVARNIGADIYITDVVFSKENSEVTTPLVVNMLKRNKTTYIRVESNAMGGMYANTLQKELTKEKVSCQVLKAFSTTNKHTRILNDAWFIKQNFVFLEEQYQNEEYRNFMKQLTSYLKNGKEKKDDAPDSCSGLSMFIRSILKHLY